MVLLLNGGETRRRWLSSSKLGLLLLAAFRSCHDLTRTSLVCGVVEKRANVVNKKGIEELSDLLLVREVKSSFERNPCFCVNNKTWLGRLEGSSTHHTPLRCIGPILTTWRTFSLLRMPSRRPRVIPATFSSFVPLIMWLSAPRRTSRQYSVMSPYEGYEDLTIRTFSAGNTDATSLDLVAEAPFVFPERCGNAGLHAGRRDLARCVEPSVLVLHGGSLARDAWQGRRWGENPAATHGARHRRCGGRRSQAIRVAVLMAVRTRGRGVLGWARL